METKEFKYQDLTKQAQVDFHRYCEIQNLQEKYDFLCDTLDKVMVKQRERNKEIDDLLIRVRNLEKENLRQKDFITRLQKQPKFQKEFYQPKFDPVWC